MKKFTKLTKKIAKIADALLSDHEHIMKKDDSILEAIDESSETIVTSVDDARREVKQLKNEVRELKNMIDSLTKELHENKTCAAKTPVRKSTKVPAVKPQKSNNYDIHEIHRKNGRVAYTARINGKVVERASKDALIDLIEASR